MGCFMSVKPSKSEMQREKQIEARVQKELKKMKRRRQAIRLCFSLVAIVCLGYFGIYIYQNQRTKQDNQALSSLKNDPPKQISQMAEPPKQFSASEKLPEVLPEYENLLKKNKKLIGWLKIVDTNIDYPVMQTVDNEYYLDHNLYQESDKNGSIFLDKDCSIYPVSTNLILYGHHMKNGQMFGGLDKYEVEEYAKKHEYIQFDTLYEYGTYQVMFVFRTKVLKEEDISFKYYQFLEAYSEQEFDSNMEEMRKMAMFDTGVSATYGDTLLTLSTCDYQEKNGRFVVVAKKVTTKELK